MEKSPEPVTVDWYIDTARERGKIVSDGKLSLFLGLTRPSVNFWRQRKAWPSDESIVKLAEIIGIDPKCALIDTKIWAAKDGHMATVWRSIKAALKLLPLLLGLTVGIPNDSNAHATAYAEVGMGHSVYYVSYRRHKIWRFSAIVARFSAQSGRFT